MRFLLGAILAFAVTSAGAQTFPAKPVTLVHGVVPGGSLDAVVRQVALSLSKELGQSVVVEARPGATGTIAAASVARAPADGYTLLFGMGANLTLGPTTMKSVGYDPLTSFAPVSEISRGHYVLVANSALPFRTVAELCEYAKANPGKLNYGSPGIGSPQHFAGDMLSRACGAQMQHIPYKGGGQAYPALMTGEIHLLFDTMPGPQIYAQSGRIRTLAVTGPQRMKSYPDLPTFSEQGYPAVNVTFMYGILAPAGTPAPVVNTLNAAIHRALLGNEMKALLASQDLQPNPGSPQALHELISSEVRRWREIIRETGFKVE